MRYDKPLTAIMIGAVSTLTGEIITRALVALGIGKYSVFQLFSLIVTLNRPSEVIGLIVDFLVGGLMGVSFYYAIEKIGQDYMVAKATIVSIAFWVLAELIFSISIEGHTIDVRPMADYYVHLSGAIGYGIILGLLFKRYLFSSAKSF